MYLLKKVFLDNIRHVTLCWNLSYNEEKNAESLQTRHKNFAQSTLYELWYLSPAWIAMNYVDLIKSKLGLSKPSTII